VEVLLAVLGGEPKPAQRTEIERLPNVLLQTSEYRLEWMDAPWDSLEVAGEWLRTLERAFEPDVVHLNHLVLADLHWHAPVLVVGHSCVLSWLCAVRGKVEPGWGRYQEAVTRSLRAASLVVAPTHDMLRALHRHYGLLLRNQVIPNGIDPRHFRALRKEKIVLSAGRLWDEGKNVAALCQIARQVPWPVFVAGATTSPDGNAVSVEGVRTLGALPHHELAAWYSLATIYALPARYEPFGLTALEAALSGCALVLGDIPSLHETWGSAARYVAPDDPGELRDALQELIANPQETAVLATLARERAAHYSAQTMAAQYFHEYGSLADQKGRSTCASYCSITH
jgi:glycosyltransferase involved in cell wall biosynthesis